MASCSPVLWVSCPSPTRCPSFSGERRNNHSDFSYSYQRNVTLMAGCSFLLRAKSRMSLQCIIYLFVHLFLSGIAVVLKWLFRCSLKLCKVLNRNAIFQERRNCVFAQGNFIKLFLRKSVVHNLTFRRAVQLGICIKSNIKLFLLKSSVKTTLNNQNGRVWLSDLDSDVTVPHWGDKDAMNLSSSGDLTRINALFI